MGIPDQRLYRSGGDKSRNSQDVSGTSVRMMDWDSPRCLLTFISSYMTISVFLVLALFMCLAWKLFQEYVTGSPLDQIPGPRASSWLTGMSPPSFSTLVPITSLLGNIPQFYDKTGKYYYKFLQQCERAVLIFQVTKH